MSRFIDYIRTHVKNFSIVDCFKVAGIADQNAAEKEFTHSVINISKWKECPVQRWAQKQIDSQFIILKERALYSYWEEVEKNNAHSFQSRSYFKYQSDLLKKQGSPSTIPCKRPVIDSDGDSDETYQPSNTSSSDSTKQPVQPANSYFHLVGAGLDSYVPPTNAKKWMADGMDLIAKFLEYRIEVYNAAKIAEQLTVIDRLALNFICLISPSSQLGNKMDSAVWEAIVKKAKEKKHMEAIPDTDALWCMKINQAARTSNDDAKGILKSWVRSNDTDEACRYQDVYRSMLKVYSPYYDTCSVNEDTFVKGTLLPLLAAYFPNSSSIFTEGANGAVSGSSRRKRQTDHDAKARKGDFSVYTCDNHLSQLVFLMECKPPRANPSDDFVKMANCLKDCLDKAIKDGADHSVLTVCGLLCESSRCKVFSMDLKYHGMYRLIEIGTFYLPRDHNNLDVMLGAFQVMNQCQKIVMEAAKVCKETIRRDGNNSDMCLPSFGTPIRLAEDQVMTLLQNVDPARLARAARKLDFSKC
ncbi:hypothetical protein BY458DRAFT_521345 [Sporodiniella umbellata]|nr:hypothetical protein BY458DRAFT_521345 [Sporodiniella umbellata]